MAVLPVLAGPRQQEILSILETGGEVVVSDLARRFNVSEMTIRRDLRNLEESGRVVRVHGGAVLGERSRFTSRLAANTKAKSKAVSKLVQFIPERGCIYLDGSTTILNLVKRLGSLHQLQVATNNVETFNRISMLKGVTPLLIGGSLDPRTDNLIGPLAMRSVEALAFECAFFSAWGVDSETGLNEATTEDAEVKAYVASRSRGVYVALDHSKLGVVAGGVWEHNKERAVLATDLEPDNPRLDRYRKMFSRII